VVFSAGQAPGVVDQYRLSHRKYWNHLFAE